MNLSISYFQNLAHQQAEKLREENEEIEQSVAKIRECDAEAPKLIREFRRRFKKFTRSPEKNEDKYREARKDMRLIATIRSGRTLTLRRLIDPDTPLSRDELCKLAESHATKHARMTAIKTQEVLAHSTDEADFAVYASRPEFQEALPKIKTLEEYLATQPRFNDILETIAKLSDPILKTTLKEYCLKTYGNDPENVLSIFAQPGVYNFATDLHRYFHAYNAARERLNDRYDRTDVQEFRFRELARHGHEPSIYRGIVSALKGRDCKDFGNGNDCARGGRCFMADHYFHLPVEVQEYILETRDLPQDLRLCFGKVRIKANNMPSLEAAKCILENPEKRLHEYDGYQRYYEVCDSFSYADRVEAAHAYLVEHSGNEDGLVLEALKYLPDEEKTAQAKKYFAGEFHTEKQTIHYLELIQYQDLQDALKAILSCKLVNCIRPLHTIFANNPVPQVLISWIINDRSFLDTSHLEWFNLLRDFPDALTNAYSSETLEKDREKLIREAMGVIQEYAFLVRGTPETILFRHIRTMLNSCIDDRIAELKQAEAYRANQHALQQKLIG